MLDRFDRRFASRSLEILEGPKEQGDEVWIRGSATYSAEGIPDLVLVLEETVRFDGDRIVHLEDRYTTEMIAEIDQFVTDYGSKVGVDLESR